MLIIGLSEHSVKTAVKQIRIATPSSNRRQSPPFYSQKCRYKNSCKNGPPETAQADLTYASKSGFRRLCVKFGLAFFRLGVSRSGA